MSWNFSTKQCRVIERNGKSSSSTKPKLLLLTRNTSARRANIDGKVSRVKRQLPCISMLPWKLFSCCDLWADARTWRQKLTTSNVEQASHKVVRAFHFVLVLLIQRNSIELIARFMYFLLDVCLIDIWWFRLQKWQFRARAANITFDGIRRWYERHHKHNWKYNFINICDIRNLFGLREMNNSQSVVAAAVDENRPSEKFIFNVIFVTKFTLH